MQLSQASIKSFQKIYQRKYGKKIDDKKAKELASGVWNLFEAIYKPILGINSKVDNFQKNNNGYEVNRKKI